MPDLLIELFSEEIPARMQTRAGEDLKKLVTDGLVEAGLTYAGAAAFSTPRRLTLSIDGLTGESRATREDRKGPKVGAPDKAIEGFLRGAGVARGDLEIRDDKKGQVYFAVIEKPGRMAADIIAEVLENAVRNFPWPKSMRWGNGTLKWVRPLHSILCILSDEAGAQVVGAERVDHRPQQVATGGGVGGLVVGELRVPQTEALVMLGRDGYISLSRSKTEIDIILSIKRTPIKNISHLSIFWNRNIRFFLDPFT